MIMLYTLSSIPELNHKINNQPIKISLPSQARQNPLASEPNKLWPMTGLGGGGGGGGGSSPPLLRRRSAE